METKILLAGDVRNVLNDFINIIEDYQYQYHSIWMESAKDVLDSFNDNPTVFVSNYFLESNDLLERCKKIPLAIFYHNRNSENATDLGLNLTLLPAIYDCKKGTVRGGIELSGKLNEYVQEKFLPLFVQFGEDKLPLINIRNVFKNNLVEENMSDTGLNKVIEQYKQKMAITVDVSETLIKVDFPKYKQTLKEQNE